ncbi:hypothetical protein ED733_004167 [Metarhizium rileyi]|uniref:Uncharacterized protein n=1 Tax=Metarhizium rileyi (strain RCEF 4871) TaxID=1649241 RepID=A0A5C6G7Y6_METRR|nr:hypothetical protein ED733_004167 [Metarhizium rileyi]
MASRTLKTVLVQVGRIGKSHVFQENPGTGDIWVAALDTAESTVKMDYPEVTGMSISGAKAHQSHTVSSHSRVLSVRFYAGEQRIISGHVYQNGMLAYSQRARATASSSSTDSWKPSRGEVDTTTWTIYDPQHKKKRTVASEDKWWYIEKGGMREYF